jgi:hypothetical protein
MSRKSAVMLGMIIGSTAGGYVPALFGAGGFSFVSIVGGMVGGILGIWIAFKLSG